MFIVAQVIRSSRGASTPTITLSHSTSPMQERSRTRHRRCRQRANHSEVYRASDQVRSCNTRSRTKKHAKNNIAVHQCSYGAYRGESSYRRKLKEAPQVLIV